MCVSQTAFAIAHQTYWGLVTPEVNVRALMVYLQEDVPQISEYVAFVSINNINFCTKCEFQS